MSPPTLTPLRTRQKWVKSPAKNATTDTIPQWTCARNATSSATGCHNEYRGHPLKSTNERRRREVMRLVRPDQEGDLHSPEMRERPLHRGEPVPDGAGLHEPLRECLAGHIEKRNLRSNAGDQSRSKGTSDQRIQYGWQVREIMDRS
jgi:hypothetical protein